MARASSPNPLEQVLAKSIGFAGGVNLRDAVNLLAPDELRRAENIILDEKGGAQKRSGCISNGTFGAAGDRIISQYTFYRGENAPQLLIHTSGGKVYYTNDPTAVTVTWTQIATGLSTTVPMSWETFNGKAYFSNGVDSYAAWDGATYTAFASAPKGKFLRLWKDTMWVSGITGTPDRVYSSNPGDAETFGVAAWVDIAKGDGDRVVGLGTDGLFLAVFKRNRYMIIYDPGLFSNRVVDFEKGCESHFSILQFESELYFLSKRGVCRFDSNGPATFVSWKLDPLFDPAVLNFAALDRAWAYTYGNRIGWALPEAGQATPTLQIEYYPRLVKYESIGGYNSRAVAPWVFHRMPATTFTRFRSGAVEYLFGGKGTENKFLQMFAAIGTDDGAFFAAIMETKANDFGAPHRTKYVRNIRVLGRGHPILQTRKNFRSAIDKTFPLDLSSASDLWTAADHWGTGTWGLDSIYREQLIHSDAYGRYIQLIFTDTQTGTGRKLVEAGSAEYILVSGEWAIYGILMEADLLGVRD